MSSESIKNNIKLMFLTVNSINALATCILPLSLGMAMALSDMEVMSAISGMALGLPMLGLAALGFSGAIQDKKVFLVIYSAITGLLSVTTCILTAHVYYISSSRGRIYYGVDTVYPIFLFFIIYTTLAAAGLAFILAKRARADSQITPRGWLLRGCGFFIAVFIGVILYGLHVFY